MMSISQSNGKNGTDMMGNSESETSRETQTAQPISPKQTRYDSGYDVPEQGNEQEVVSMLELDERVGTKIRDIRGSRFQVRLE